MQVGFQIHTLSFPFITCQRTLFYCHPSHTILFKCQRCDHFPAPGDGNLLGISPLGELVNSQTPQMVVSDAFTMILLSIHRLLTSHSPQHDFYKLKNHNQFLKLRRRLQQNILMIGKHQRPC